MKSASYYYLICLLVLMANEGYGQKIETDKRIVNDTVYLDFINQYEAPIEFRVRVKDSFKSRLKTKEILIVNSLDTLKNAIIYPKSMVKDSSKVLTDFISIKGNFGYKAVIDVDTDFEYALPYPKGKTYRIIQTFGGSFSHNEAHSKYAIDFSLKINDVVTASRDGKVVYVKEDSKEYGGRDYIDKANKIIILQNDGTYAHYVHLNYEGALVNEGDLVKQGDTIGRVGLSGFTTLPHLHFVVMKERGLSIPIKFKGFGNKLLKKNKTYTHR